MKVMVVWKTVPGKYKTAVAAFLERGAPVPAGAKTVGRWHSPASTRGWHLIETNDLGLVAEHVAEWADVLEVDAYPVLEDAEAGAAAKRALGK
jgi:hypothetical protein